jgi:hypothetical protein
MNDNLKIIGRVDLQLLDEFGVEKTKLSVDNLVVTAGKVLIASRIANSGTAPSHIGVGSSNTPAALTQTALVAQVSSRVACSIVSSTGAIARFTSTFAPGASTGTLQEAGLFNASTGVTMISRIAFGAITKAAGDTLIVNWYLTVN